MATRTKTLSPDDLDLLKRFADGDSYREVADSRGLASPSGIQFRVNRIWRILGANCMTQAVYIAAKQGLI